MATSPTTANTTWQLLEQQVAVRGKHIFLADGEISLSYQETQLQCRQLAGALLAKGFAHGQRAAIWAPNIYQWVIAALAIQSIGGVLVTINTRFKGSEAAQLLRDSEASTLFCIETFLGFDYLKALKDEELPALKHCIAINSSDTNSKYSWESTLASGSAWLVENAALFEQRRDAVVGSDVSDIIFTSGTTGRAKGVMTQHAQNVQAFTEFAQLLGLDSDDRYLVINPFFHSFGYKAGMLAILSQGATLIPMATFDIDQVLATIVREKISVMPGPPTIFQSLINHPRLAEFDISSLTKATTGAAVIPVSLIEEMQSVLQINTVITAYGLSECCGVATMCRRGDSAEIIAKTSGRALPGVELAIVDSKNQPLPAGSHGEIVLRGFNVMQGYLNNPAASAEAIDSDGWLHTGDIGFVDAQGNLSITDRLKDMYISGGFNCYPAEIESALNSHADVVMCAVIGVPDERMGEVGRAYIVLREGAQQSAETLYQWCREVMANYKVPREFRLVEALPLNASGKVQKTQLREHA